MRLLVWAPRLRGFCGLLWAPVGGCAGRSPLLLVSWLAWLLWLLVALLVALLVGCEVCGVMDGGRLDSLSFERGGRSADYVPASLCFFLLVALRFCACFSLAPR